MLKVLGAGFGRTGTSSLQAALEELLGGKCYHMKSALLQREHLQAWSDFAAGKSAAMDWAFLLRGYTAAVDFPVCIYYRELMEAFPEAKIVLTLRDPQQWWASFIRLQRLVQATRPLSFCIPRLRMIARFTDRLIIDNVFGGRLEKQDCIGAYERHNRAVRDCVPRDRLLEFDVRQGWAPLCSFLSLPVPGTPFPHRNAGIAPLGKLLGKTLLRWLVRRES